MAEKPDWDEVDRQLRRETLSDYDPAIRNFLVKAVGLKLFRRAFTRDDDNGSPISIKQSIYGTGISEKDSVGVIGEDESTKEFHLTIVSDESASEDWEFIRRCDSLLDEPDNPATRYKYGKLDKNPPTASLGLSPEDWEVGASKAWCLECMVPPDVLERLVLDMLADRVDEVVIGISWVGGLVYDKHAPPSVPTKWGLNKTGEDTGNVESLHGHVKSVTWEVTKQSSEQQSISSDVADQDYWAKEDSREKAQDPEERFQEKLMGAMSNLGATFGQIKIVLWVLAILVLVSLFV